MSIEFGGFSEVDRKIKIPMRGKGTAFFIFIFSSSLSLWGGRQGSLG